MDVLNITQFFVILANFHKWLFFFFFCTEIGHFRCIIYKHDIKLKYNLKHNFVFLSCVGNGLTADVCEFTWEQKKPKGHKSRRNWKSVHLPSCSLPSIDDSPILAKFMAFFPPVMHANFSNSSKQHGGAQAKEKCATAWSCRTCSSAWICFLSFCVAP